MSDDYRRVGLSSRSWSRKERKAMRSEARAALRRAVAHEPCEPEVHPREIEALMREAFEVHDASMRALAGLDDVGEQSPRAERDP